MKINHFTDFLRKISKHWKLQQTFDRCYFFPKKMRRLISAWVIFFEVLDFRNLLEAFFISKNQWGSNGYKFMKFWSWNELGTTSIRIYIYIHLLGIGSITLSHEFPKLLNPTHSNSISQVPQHWQPDAWTGLRAFVRPNFTWTFVWSMAMYPF